MSPYQHFEWAYCTFWMCTTTFYTPYDNDNIHLPAKEEKKRKNKHTYSTKVTSSHICIRRHVKYRHKLNTKHRHWHQLLDFFTSQKMFFLRFFCSFQNCTYVRWVLKRSFRPNNMHQYFSVVRQLYQDGSMSTKHSQFFLIIHNMFYKNFETFYWVK